MGFILRDDIELPYMRLEVIGALESLGDVEEQKGWSDPKYTHPFWDSLSLEIDVLFDDIPFEEFPEDQIGYSIIDKEELKVILAVLATLNRVLNEIGIKKPDPAYINSPLWQEVVQASQKAYQLLSKNDEEYLKTHPEALVT